jgi:hypothetical protein
MKDKFNVYNNVLGWVAFVVGLVTYTLTLEPTVSFWDCGEFISASYRLQICHPPGAPLFLIIGRLFSLFAGGDVTKVAFCINMVSAIAGGLCGAFFFWTITHLGKKILMRGQSELSGQQIVALMASGMVGALTLIWSDTFWFSAVEAEVYASSSFFTTLTFWCILKWENIADEKRSDRWLILIGYLIGLAIGVHLLNLLVIPAIVYVYYFKKYKFTRMGFIKASGVAVAAIAIVQFGIIPGMPSLMANFDYLFVNSLGAGFDIGIYFFLVIVGVFFIASLYYTQTDSRNALIISVLTYAIIFLGSMIINPSFMRVIIWAVITGAIYYFVFMTKSAKAYVNTVILCVAFVIIGYSSYAMIMIRSAANPPIDMNDPQQPFSLLSYLNRDQYGDNPLIYGQYFYAKVVDVEKGPMQYRKGENKYEEVGPKPIRVYDPKDETLLPRMWADRGDYVQSYRQWENIPEGKHATFGKNIDFLLTYQMRFMYWRYFMWNFVGRQNDHQGFGGNVDGNWITGISFIDSWLVGPQKNMPDSIKNEKARNTYFGLPLLLGLIGLFWHFKRAKEDAIVVTTLFLFTGAFIILYLNFPAHQPRERDYAYVGSYQTFMIWIGLGVLALVEWLSKKMDIKLATGVVSVASIACVPVLMGQQNWNDHDRSVRTTALDFASDYLNSCDKNAILFTNGDNDTYPLWYAQNVEGIRSDIRVINLSLLNTDWYADGLKNKVYDSEPVPFSMTPDKYVQGVRDVVYYYQNPEVEKRYGINQNDYYPLKNIIQFITDDKDPLGKLQSQGGESYSYYPTKKFFLKIDKEHVLKTGAVKSKDAAEIADSMKFEISNQALMKADLITLDVLSTVDWNRPIYFAITTGSEVYLNMTNYFQLEGLTYHIVPIANKDQVEGGSYGRINTDILYDNLMNKFKWGNMDKPGVYLDETILRQTKNFRNIFYRLSMKLVEEGKKDLAVKALDRAMQVMPKENVPYDVFVIRLCEAYYAAGAAAKANAILKDMIAESGAKYKYYSGFRSSSSKMASVQEEVKENEQIMEYCQQVAQFNKQDSVAKQFRTQIDNILAGK